jgi:redox-sensitive bicupin YhaK (pirin superfamily)
MISVIKAQDRYHHQTDWLSTYWHFSFDHYWDPQNVSFGALRVFNDDVIQPGTGFPLHGHRDMEIITCVLEGELEHEDNQGNRGIIRAGEVQVMSAGTGILHAERNPSKTEALHLLQIWILPRTKGRRPRWEQRAFTKAERQDVLLPAVSGADGSRTLQIDQDATVFISALGRGQDISHVPAGRRCAYLFVISGSLEVNGIGLAGGDQARITHEPRLALSAAAPAELILLDLP